MHNSASCRRVAGLRPVAARIVCASLTMALCIPLSGAGPALELTLQTRVRDTDRAVTTNQRIDAAKIGVVIVDMWNTNDCMTNAQRAAALVPRMNKVLEAARRLGMQIIGAPTDVASQY